MEIHIQFLTLLKSIDPKFSISRVIWYKKEISLSHITEKLYCLVQRKVEVTV